MRSSRPSGSTKGDADRSQAEDGQRHRGGGRRRRPPDSLLLDGRQRADLGSGQRNGIQPLLVQSHAQHRHGDALAGGKQHVHFTCRWIIADIGSHTGGQVTHQYRIPPQGTPIIQLDINAEELGRNYPIKLGLQGDARNTLRRMLSEAKQVKPRTEWLGRVHALIAEWRAGVDEQLALAKEIVRKTTTSINVIQTAGMAPGPVVVKNNFHNVPDNGTVASWDLGYPGSADPEQFYMTE